MQFSSLFLLSAAATTALAGTTTITNHCAGPIYIWTIDQSPATASTSSNTPSILQPGSSATSQLHTTSTSMKISNTSTLNNDATTQFEYVIANNQLWYDISFVNCAAGQSSSNCPGASGGLSMEATSASKSCGKFYCAAGAYCPSQAYYVDIPSVKLGLQDPVNACPVGMDDVSLVMNVCADQTKSSKRSVAGRVWME